MKFIDVKSAWISCVCLLVLALSGCFNGDSKESEAPQQNGQIPIKPHQKESEHKAKLPQPEGADKQHQPVYKGAQSGHNYQQPSPNHTPHPSAHEFKKHHKGAFYSSGGNSHTTHQKQAANQADKSQPKGTTTLPHNSPIQS